MKKSKRQTQKTQTANGESFAAVAERLGAALADCVAHPDCPQSIADAIGELESSVFNRFPDVEISLRYSFPRRLVAVFEQIA